MAPDPVSRDFSIGRELPGVVRLVRWSDSHGTVYETLQTIHIRGT